MISRVAVERFVQAHTRIGAPSLCPEIRLHMADDLDSLWASEETAFECTGLPPPFWSVPWIGGQALARYTLDHAALVRDRSVLDVGAGCGICAIAAAKAGGRSVAAYDPDPVSRIALLMNARLNQVGLEVLDQDVIGGVSQWDVVLVGDLWYERFLAQRLNVWLQDMARAGTFVLLGDPGRAYFPRHAATPCERYSIAACPSMEREATAVTAVWRVH